MTQKVAVHIVSSLRSNFHNSGMDLHVIHPLLLGMRQYRVQITCRFGACADHTYNQAAYNYRDPASQISRCVCNCQKVLVKCIDSLI